MEFIYQRQKHPNVVHTLRERFHLCDRYWHFQVLKDLMPVMDRIDLVQRKIEERLEIVIRPGGRDGSHYLIEIQISEEGRCIGALCVQSIFTPGKEYAWRTRLTDGRHTKTPTKAVL